MSDDIQDPLKALADICKPDDRQANLVDSLEDTHSRLATLVLHSDVPVDVRQLFETAKNVRLYAYFAFRFHQVSEMVAFQALEFALRERLNREEARVVASKAPARRPPLGLSGLLRRAADDGWIHNEGFSGKLWRARNALLSERTVEALSNSARLSAGVMRIQEPSEFEIAERAQTINVVELVVTYLPKCRNEIAHGSPVLIPRDFGLMQDICDAVNMLFE